MSAEITKLLRKTPIFSTLDSSNLKKITSFFKEKTYSSDEILFKEGTLGDTLYIIKEGAIKITRAAKEGEEESSRSLRREGDIFGESGFIDETPRPATAQATKTTKVFQLSRSDFLTILNDNPLTAYQIVKVLSARLKQADLRVIEELKEKNEQLQQTVQALEDNPERMKNKDRSKKAAEGDDNLYIRLLSVIPYSVICTGKDGKIVFFNQAAENEFGYKSEEIVGKPVGLLWSETSWSRLSQSVEDKLRQQNMWEGEIIAKRRKGGHFLSFTGITEMKGSDGKSEGRVYLSQDVTQKISEEKEERITEEMASRQQIAEEIGKSMGREVKKLSDVFETLPSVLDGTDSGESKKKINIMKNALDDIRDFVEDLSTPSRVELDKKPLDLESFFREELLVLKSQQRFRDIDFVTHFDEKTPKAKANKRQLQKMLFAILDNAASALKPVSDRIRTITIEVGKAGQKQEVQIQISDNGMGISPADLSKIFKERFPGKNAGLGLGLLSVAKIVDDHGGDIEVYSDEGAYTLFVIKLPAYEERAVPQSQEEPALKA
jgi:PAS domain S-box-containing protein